MKKLTGVLLACLALFTLIVCLESKANAAVNDTVSVVIPSFLTAGDENFDPNIIDLKPAGCRFGKDGSLVFELSPSNAAELRVSLLTEMEELLSFEIKKFEGDIEKVEANADYSKIKVYADPEQCQGIWESEPSNKEVEACVWLVADAILYQSVLQVPVDKNNVQIVFVDRNTGKAFDRFDLREMIGAEK